MVLRALITTIFLFTLCLLLAAADAGEEAPEIAPGTTPAATAPAGAAAPNAATDTKAALDIVDAVEGILDLDEPTREAAHRRLQEVTVADLPTLEKYVEHADPEIRRQARLLVLRLKRGTFAIALKFPDGTPAADLPMRVEVYEGQVQNLNGRGVPTVNPPSNQFKPAKVEIDGEFRTDAAGQATIGAWNDGDYTYRIEVDAPLPRQSLTGTCTLSQHAKPLELTVHRGAGVKVTVKDEQNQPAAHVSVYCFDNDNLLQSLGRAALSQFKLHLRLSAQAETDDNGVATFHELAPRGQLTLVSVKDGCNPTVMEKLAVKDGGTTETTLVLKPIQPVKITWQFNDNRNQPMPEARVLLIRQQQLGQIVGPRWNTELHPDKFDEYIKAGAIDLGATDKDGQATTTVPPDQYRVFAHGKDGKELFQGMLNLSPMATNQVVPVRLNPMAIRKR